MGFVGATTCVSALKYLGVPFVGATPCGCHVLLKLQSGRVIYTKEIRVRIQIHGEEYRIDG